MTTIKIFDNTPKSFPKWRAAVIAKAVELELLPMLLNYADFANFIKSTGEVATRNDYEKQRILLKDPEKTLTAKELAALSDSGRKALTRQYTTQRDNMALLKADILNSLDDDAKQLFTNPLYGTANVSASSIYESMVKEYGKVTKTDIVELRNSLNKSYNTAEFKTPQQWINTMRQIHSQLEEADQPVSEMDKVTALIEACTTPERVFDQAIGHFHIVNPEISQQNFDDLAKIVLATAKNLPSDPSKVPSATAAVAKTVPAQKEGSKQAKRVDIKGWTDEDFKKARWTKSTCDREAHKHTWTAPGKEAHTPDTCRQNIKERKEKEKEVVPDKKKAKASTAATTGSYYEELASDSDDVVE